MRNKSVLNRGLLMGSLRRFWPLWLVYGVVLALMLVAPAYSSVSAIMREGGSLQDRLSEVQSLWTLGRYQSLVFAFVAAIVVATAESDHLFSARAATFVGSLPLRRSEVFLTYFFSGLLPLVAVPALAALCLLPLCGMAGPLFEAGMVGQWYVLVVALSFVFYALAQLACHLAGARPVAVLLYGVFNFLSICLETAAVMVVSCLVYGIDNLDLGWEWLSPFVGLIVHGISDWHDQANVVAWPVVGGYCVAALALAALTMRLFARRRLESAGDSVAYEPARPVLKYLASVSMALLFGVVFCLLFVSSAGNGVPLGMTGALGLWLAMAVGALLGVLFAEMIMSRSTHVWARCWRGGLVVAAAAAAFVGACVFDVLGVEHRVPAPEQVERVTVWCDYSHGAEMTLTDHDEVAQLCDLQRDLIAYHGAGKRDDISFAIHFVYQLKGGGVMERSYPVYTPYYAYRHGQAKADDGALLLDRYEAIANSAAGRAARYSRLLDGESVRLSMLVSYSGQMEAYEDLYLTAAERAELLAGPLRHDLMEAPTGEVFEQGFDEERDAELFDATLYVYGPDDEYLAGITIDERICPKTYAWLQAHHPEVLRAA